MFDTPITMVGNVLTAPQWRRTTQTNTFMVTFRVAATSRRFVKEQGGWVDGDSLRVRVTCWRRLAENVSVSVQLGDPVIVHGRLYTRDWVDDGGTRHSSYELEAVSVGFDLARGVGKFARRKVAGSTDMVEGPANDARVGGELTEEMEDPGRPADLPADNDLFEPFDPQLYDESRSDESDLAPSRPAASDVDPSTIDPSLPDPAQAAGTDGADPAQAAGTDGADPAQAAGTEGAQPVRASAGQSGSGQPDGSGPEAPDRELAGAGRGRRSRGQ